MQSQAPSPAQAFTLSASAAAQINKLKAQENKAALRFRVTIKGGGCSGFQYEFALDDAEPQQEDRIFARDGAEVVMDSMSLELAAGAELDYKEDLASAGFEIKNPNATARCGCGNSFSVAL